MIFHTLRLPIIHFAPALFGAGLFGTYYIQERVWRGERAFYKTFRFWRFTIGFGIFLNEFSTKRQKSLKQTTKS